MRVKAGGHNVPTIDVRRRFYRGIYNLFHLYRPLLDFWMLFDHITMPPPIRGLRQNTIGNNWGTVLFN